MIGYRLNTFGNLNFYALAPTRWEEDLFLKIFINPKITLFLSRLAEASEGVTPEAVKGEDPRSAS